MSNKLKRRPVTSPAAFDRVEIGGRANIGPAGRSVRTGDGQTTLPRPALELEVRPTLVPVDTELDHTRHRGRAAPCRRVDAVYAVGGREFCVGSKQQCSVKPFFGYYSNSF
jgi:hypothetical protein